MKGDLAVLRPGTGPVEDRNREALQTGNTQLDRLRPVPGPVEDRNIGCWKIQLVGGQELRPVPGLGDGAH
nr:hypothetical protein [Micromonospora sp. DSM 115978]